MGLVRHNGVRRGGDQAVVVPSDVSGLDRFNGGCCFSGVCSPIRNLRI